MVRIAWFDPYSGADGDLVLGALVDAGVPLDDLRSMLARLPVDGYSLSVEPAISRGVSGTRVGIEVHQDPGYLPWEDLLNQSSLPDPVRSASMAACDALGAARAHVHGMPAETLPLGQIVAITGAAAGIHLLDVEQVYSGPLGVGQGMVERDGERIPLPDPVTARLLEDRSAPSRAVDQDVALLDPVGAAILTVFAEFRRPTFHTSAIGYGIGRREFDWPHALRLWIGDAAPEDIAAHAEEKPGPAELVLDATIDDMPPAFYELLVERLYEAGAGEVFQTPVIAGTGRQGTMVSAIAPSGRRAEVEEVFITNSTATTIRVAPIDRTSAGRAEATVATRWGEVRLALKIWRGQVLEAVPVIDDCREIARDSNAPLQLVYSEAVRMGDVFVGQRMAADENEGR